ncbi:sel1 repeat family protein, partial [Aggregatibacter actinomycetemcomitans]|nr:sel1 repeat family protein [Aggregatibacter actinomycetemcomitans]
MVAEIFKWVVILFIAIIFLVYWGISTVLDSGITVGGTASGYSGKNSITRTIDAQQIEKANRDKMNQLQAKLAFTCKHEEKPELSEETQQLYNYALYHDLHNMWTGKKGDAVWNGLARYYRIAAMNGDYKANLRLQYLLKSGRISSDMPQTEVHNLNEALAKQLPATAYYNLYGYLDVGYGVRTEKDGKYAYLRKAADLGSREAQYVVGDILTDINDEETRPLRLKIYEQLLACASEPGLGDASEMLGIALERKKEYQKAIAVFHQGVKNGSELSANVLARVFNNTREKDYLENLNLKKDSERARRYKIIGDYLYNKDYLQPKVPDLDEIVPLPPAPLPDWDGKIAFQRWFEGEPPAKPDEALVYRLALQAGLNPDTGLDEKTGMPKKPTK